jgi:SAM-dependent methyltransferase
MQDYGPETYGDRIASEYDALYERELDTEAAVDALARLADGGPVLELAIGTGRLAIPLAQRGLAVHGIDASQEMVARLRSKPGGEDIPVTLGDFADVDVEGSFSLIFVAFNTLFALLTQEDQLRCFANAAAHLRDGGRFVVEAFVPDLGRFDRGQRVGVSAVSIDRVDLEVSRHDPVNQRVDSQHVFVTEDGTTLAPVSLRYAFPSELDLMARLAGFELQERWGSWSGEPFTNRSDQHVSVYGARSDRMSP